MLSGGAASEHPAIECRARDADETTYTDDREVRLLGEIAELALGDRAVARERFEVKELGPLGAGINLVCGHRTESPLG